MISKITRYLLRNSCSVFYIQLRPCRLLTLTVDSLVKIIPVLGCPFHVHNQNPCYFLLVRMPVVAEIWNGISVAVGFFIA